ncbi:molecular chaperone, partial [Escherichia coli O157]
MFFYLNVILTTGNIDTMINNFTEVKVKKK